MQEDQTNIQQPCHVPRQVPGSEHVTSSEVIVSPLKLVVLSRFCQNRWVGLSCLFYWLLVQMLIESAVRQAVLRQLQEESFQVHAHRRLGKRAYGPDARESAQGHRASRRTMDFDGTGDDAGIGEVSKPTVAAAYGSSSLGSLGKVCVYVCA